MIKIKGKEIAIPFDNNEKTNNNKTKKYKNNLFVFIYFIYVISAEM